MAKKAKAEVEVETVAAEPAKGRKVLLTDPSTGEQVARVDVIKTLFSEGKKRGEIVKILAETYGHVVPYQIVFAATKPAKEAAEEAPAAEEASE